MRAPSMAEAVTSAAAVSRAPRPEIIAAGRIARLGIVVDLGIEATKAAELAAMCERAGLDAVWFAPLLTRADDAAIISLAEAAAAATASLIIGVRVDRLPRAAPAEAAGRFEVTLPDGAVSTGPCGAVRVWQLTGSPSSAVAEVAVPAWAADERRHGGGGLAVVVSASIGRTTAEATARAVGDPLLAAIRLPLEDGLFGTLEECQQRAGALVCAGVVDIRCVLPAARDLHDVIAQLSAVTIESTGQDRD
jgi:hypothetical protein